MSLETAVARGTVELGEGLTTRDRSDLAGGRLRIWQLMRDCQWHTVPEMHQAAGEDGPALQGDRRWREVRAVLKEFGWTWEKILIPGAKRLWQYRLNPPIKPSEICDEQAVA
jgi:hypothetical protein